MPQPKLQKNNLKTAGRYYQSKCDLKI